MPHKHERDGSNLIPLPLDGDEEALEHERQQEVATLAELLERPDLVRSLPPEDIPVFLCRLHCQVQGLEVALTARVLELTRAAAPRVTTPADDRLLSPEEAAKRLGVNVRWLHRNAKHLQFARRLGRRSLRFSEAGLLRWVQKQRA